MGKKKNNCRKYFIIYETTNLTNSKVYRGKHGTYTPYIFDGYLGSGKAIKAAIKKYGRKNFVRKTLFVTEDEGLAYLKEKELVDTEFVRRKDTYNLIMGGIGTSSGEDSPSFGLKRSKESLDKMSGENHHMWGKHHTDEAKKKQSDATKGRVYTKERNKKISDAAKGRIFTDERKKNISKALKGRIFTDEWKKNLSDAVSGKNHWNFGGIASEETRKKQSDAAKGKIISRKTRIKLAIFNLGGEEIFYGRLKDIEEIDKVHGYKVKLARKWGVSHSAVRRFIKHWCNKGGLKNETNSD